MFRVSLKCFTTMRRKCLFSRYIAFFFQLFLLLSKSENHVSYNSIPKDSIKAPRRPLPPIAAPLTAPLDLVADAELPVAVPVAVPVDFVEVVVAVELGNMPAAVVPVAELLLFKVMNEADSVVVEAEVAGTELTCTVTVVLAEPAVVVEALPAPPALLVVRPVMVK